MASHRGGNGFSDHEVLGTYSRVEGEYHNDRRNRRFFVEPDDDRPNFDLLQGIDEFVEREELGVQVTPLEDVLKWTRDHCKELEKAGVLKKSGGGETVKKLDVNFMGRRGVLVRLLRAGQDTAGLEILVTLCNGTYYIENMKDHDLERSSREMTFTGHRFQQYVTSYDDAEEGEPDTARPVNMNAYSSYYCMMKLRCGGHKLLFHSEVHAERRDSNHRPPGNYVIIKTNKPLNNDKARSSFNRYKTLNWWSQAHLAGIPEICVGWRDDARHVVTSVDMMKTDDLPAKSGGFWSPEDCTKKFISLLDDIKEHVRDDDPRAVYRLKLPEVERGNYRVIKQRLQSRKLIPLGRKEDDYVMLPDWYLKDVLNIRQ